MIGVDVKVLTSFPIESIQGALDKSHPGRLYSFRVRSGLQTLSVNLSNPGRESPGNRAAFEAVVQCRAKWRELKPIFEGEWADSAAQWNEMWQGRANREHTAHSLFMAVNVPRFMAVGSYTATPGTTSFVDWIRTPPSLQYSTTGFQFYILWPTFSTGCRLRLQVSGPFT